MSPKYIQHLPYRLGKLSRKRMVLHIDDRLRQFSHDRVYRRHRSMPSSALCLEFNIGKTFLGNTDQGTFPVNSRKYIFHNRAALVNDESRPYPSLLEQVHNRRTGRSVDLLLSRKRQIDIMLRHEAFCDQLLRGFHDAAECPFRIKSSPSPDHSVLHDPFKSRLIPQRLFHRDHIIMGHQDDRIFRFLSFPVVHHTVHSHEFPRAGLMHLRIKLWEEVLKFSELLFIDQTFIIIRDSFAADHLPHIVNDLLLVKLHLLSRWDQLRMRPEQRRADQ